MTSTTDFDNADITQQYSRINTRFELSNEELDNDNSTVRLFERSRIKALAGEFCMMWPNLSFWAITQFEDFYLLYFISFNFKSYTNRPMTSLNPDNWTFNPHILVSSPFTSPASYLRSLLHAQHSLVWCSWTAALSVLIQGLMQREHIIAATPVAWPLWNWSLKIALHKARVLEFLQVF